MNTIKEILGLTDKEMEIYQYLLRNPNKNAAEIAQGISMQRPNVYDLLKTLLSKGLVSYTTREKIKIYSGVNPSKLKDIYEFKKDLLNEKENEVNFLVKSLLKNMVSDNSNLKIQFYKGLKGMRSVLMDSVGESRKTKKEMLIIRLNSHDLPSLDKTYTDRFFRLRKKYKLKSRYLRLKDTKFFQDDLVESKIISDKYNSPTGWYIYGDKVSIWLFPKNETIVNIENRDIADALRSYFEIIWNSVK